VGTSRRWRQKGEDVSYLRRANLSPEMNCPHRQRRGKKTFACSAEKRERSSERKRTRSRVRRCEVWRREVCWTPESARSSREGKNPLQQPARWQRSLVPEKKLLAIGEGSAEEKRRRVPGDASAASRSVLATAESKSTNESNQVALRSRKPGKSVPRKNGIDAKGITNLIDWDRSWSWVPAVRRRRLLERVHHCLKRVQVAEEKGLARP